MKKHLLMPVAALVLLAGCQYNKDNFEGLEDSTQPTDVMNVSYTLTNADYGTISDNTTNQAIAKAVGVDKALGYVKTDFFLSEDIPAATYVPAFLAGKYYTADPGSSVKVTYNYKENKSELWAAYSTVKIYQPSNDDYKAIYGASEFAPYLNGNTSSKVTTLVSNKYKDAKDGDVVFVDYRSATGTNNVLKDPLLWQNFEGIAAGNLSSFKDWLNKGNWFVSSKGGTEWKVTSYDDNQYVQYSAFGTKGECVGWLISPAIAVGAADNFSFDLKVGNWNANCLRILISDNFDGSNPDNAIWNDVTNDFEIPEVPTSGYASSFASAGDVPLVNYSGSNIYIAFKYIGSGVTPLATTTYQIDNIMVGSTLPANGGYSAVPTYAVRVYDAKNAKWNNPDKKVSVLAYSDYIAMGQSRAYFTADVLAANYIPTYLAKQVAYPLNEEVRVVMYRYYTGKEVKIYSDEYVYSSETNRWALNSRVVQKTDQFVYSAEGKWNFDPSTTVTLKSKEQAVKTFYQTIVDWVKANKGMEYIGSKLDSEYFFGSSAYNCNFDFRPSAWKAQNAAAYGNMSDADLKALMLTRLPEAFLPGLEATYPNAAPVEGVNVIYTVNFSIYDGSATNNWTIKYEVKEKGKFTYVENSLAEVK